MSGFRDSERISCGFWERIGWEKDQNPGSVTGILANLDYGLFVTKAPDPTTWERLRNKLQEEGPKQLIDLVGKLVLACILFYLSFHGIKIKPER